jgi:hypothetical protein
MEVLACASSAVGADSLQVPAPQDGSEATAGGATPKAWRVPPSVAARPRCASGTWEGDRGQCIQSPPVTLMAWPVM